MAEMLDFTVNLSMLTSGNFNATVGPAAQKLSELSAKMQQLNNTSKNITGYQKQAQKLEQLRGKLDAARKKVKDMQTVMRSGGTVDARLFTKANEEAARLQQQVQENTKKLGEFRTSLNQAGVGTSDLAMAQQRLQTQTDAARRAQERLSAAQSRYADLQNQLSWGNIKGTVMGAMAGFSVLKAPVKLAADFESAMARVKAVAFTNEGSDMTLFDKLSNQAAQLGADTQFTAIQAAHAQENLLRANMKPEDVLKAMPAVLNMSSAEGMDIDTASAIISKVLGGMNLGGEYAGRLADILAYTSANSNTNIANIGEAFKMFAPIASKQNISMEKAAAYIGVLANSGYEASDAGQALKATYQQLAKLPPEAEKLMKSLGVAYQTRDGRMRELPDLLKAISQAMEDRKYGEFKQLSVMETIFGKRSAAPMLAFMAKAVAGEADIMEAGVQNNSFGRAGQMADINLDTLNGQLAILSSAWDRLRTTIGEMFGPVVREGVEWLSKALSGINDIIKKYPDLSKALAFGAASVGAVKLIASVRRIGKAILQLPSAWLEVQNATRAASETVSAVAPTVSKIGGVFNWLKNLIMAHPLIALGTLVATGVYLAIKHWDKLKEWWNSFVIPNIWLPLKTHTLEAIDYIKGLWEDFKQWILDKFANLNPFNWEMPEWLKNLGGSSEQQIKNANAAMGGWLPPTIKAHAEGGILTRPHVGLVAEAGAEAIIPLTNRSRGIPLVMQAAKMLGLPVERTSHPALNGPLPFAWTGESQVPHAKGGFRGVTSFASHPALNGPLPFAWTGESMSSPPVLRGEVSDETSPPGPLSLKRRWGEVMSLKELSQSVSNYRYNQSNFSSTSNNRAVNLPAVNLTVNVTSQEGERSESIAMNIADKVREVLADMMNLEERVSFA